MHNYTDAQCSNFGRPVVGEAQYANIVHWPIYLGHLRMQMSEDV